ncbi:unnamed protein product [Enterobius vermicularis]|uniref:WW domain-containing protein n=1 Tax=Enterobius vermicularis TaxID=51028 RepID=A0A0N4V206_ENTVE|nr:unnamed protein product [Enterobius vermicularis]
MAASKRERVHITGLVHPWSAFRSKKHNGKIFYFNSVTGESTWKMPSILSLNNVSNSSISVSKRSKNKKKNTALVTNRKRTDDQHETLEDYIRLPRMASSSDTQMEVDDNEGKDFSAVVSQNNEPMEVDIVGEINAYRQESVGVASQYSEFSFSSFMKNHANATAFWEQRAKRTCVLIVVDTCLLLQDISVLKQAAIADGISLLIPYIVLEELDGLKIKGTSAISAKVRRVISFLLQFCEEGNDCVYLENYFEHQKYVHELGHGYDGDDMVLKCALAAKMKSEQAQDGIDVYLATCDKNLALKSRAAQLTVMSYEDVLDIVRQFRELDKMRNHNLHLEKNRIGGHSHRNRSHKRLPEKMNQMKLTCL